MPDVNGLTSDDTLGWKLWDTLCHLRTGALCVVAIVFPRTYGVRLCLWLTAGWFTGQAIDEALGGNHFNDGLWEYPAYVVYFTYIYFAHGKAKG